MIVSRFLAIETTTMLLIVYILISGIGLTIARKVLVKKGKSLKLWCVLCLMTIVPAIIHFYTHQFKGNEELGMMLYGGIYVAAFLVVLLVVLCRWNRVFNIYSSVANMTALLGCLFSLLMLCSNNPGIHNMTHKDYTDAFLASVDRMENEYALTEWKDIDYSQIKAEILPMVQEAETNNDPVAYYIAMLNYCYYFRDAHTAININDGSVRIEASKRLAGNDYGFIMYTLDNGKTAAFLVDENSKAYKSGIRSGTLITSWDGVPIDEAISEVRVIYPFERIYALAVAESEDKLKPMFLSGKGDADIEVGYIDQDGTERKVILESMGSLQTRLNLALGRYFAEGGSNRCGNFETTMLTDDCGYLRISSEAYDSFLDIKAYITGKYPEITEMLSEKLNNLKAEGMDSLIIDLRGNTGGSGEISMAVAALFTDEKELGYDINGTTDCRLFHDKRYIEGTGEFSDIEVVVLINSNCGSAGDMLNKFLMNCDNVTVMGISSSSCVGQMSGGECVLTDSMMSIVYPVNITLDENGVQQIDTKADRVTRLPNDIYIPVTEEVAIAIFEEGEDYELAYAIEYLEIE